jgi:hypothetical protein
MQGWFASVAALLGVVSLLGGCATDGPGPIPFAVGTQAAPRIVTAPPVPEFMSGGMARPAGGGQDPAFPDEGRSPSDSPAGAFFGVGQQQFYGYN